MASNDTMLIRGAIQDRLWGKSLGALGRRAVSGQLTIRSGSDTYLLVFDSGHVVAASAPGISAIGLALQQELIDVAQAAELERHRDRDPAARLGTLLPADQVLRLRRQAIAAAATRTFALETGDFVFDSEISLPVVANTAMHVGGLIYHGVTAYLDDARLEAAIRELGFTFRVRADGVADLQYFGFGEPELIVVRALADGIGIQQIDSLPATERRIAFATIYTLASIGALYCEGAVNPPRMARGTFDPTPQFAFPRTSTSRMHDAPQRPTPRGTQPPPSRAPMVATGTPQARPPVRLDNDPAIAAFRRGQAALRDERLDTAITELSNAVELAPNELEYKCALAWARFCGAQDKSAVAGATRTILKQAALKSDHPVVPYYYLGLVERILGRTPQALEHFQQVLELDPSHREAGTEVRFLSRTSGPIKR
jgi:tetratricopeptide (TPR) repeat protein